MVEFLRRNKSAQIVSLMGPGAFWLIFFFFLPILIIFGISFLTKGSGGPRLPITLEQYERAFDEVYISLFLRSLWIAFVSTLLTLLIAYPVTVYISRLNKKWRDLAVFMVMIPFWTNFLVRTYAMQFMLRANGPINAGLLAMFGEDGWLTPLLGGANSPLFMEGPAELLFTPGAIMIGLVYGNLPFMILPLYSSMEKFDWSLLEAANDLGANWWRSFIRVLLPITLPGLIAGSILVFVPALGNYVTVDLMGGGTSNMIGRAIAQQFGSSNNWPFGSALSLLLMVIVSIAAVVYFRVGRGEQK